jgi:hypothetical protein
MTLDALEAVFEDTVSSADISMLNKYVYQTINYNPVLYQNYLNFSWYLNSSYKNTPEDVMERYRNISKAELGVDSMANFLAFCSGIYEIEITSLTIDSSENHSPNDVDRLDDIVCIEAKVTDIIKGYGSLLHNNDAGQDPYLSFSFRNSYTTFVPENERGLSVSQIKFQFDSVGVDSAGVPIYETSISDDSNIFCKVHNVGVGKRYLLFANLWMHHYTIAGGAICYIVPLRLYQREGGLFEISSDELVDSTNYFGQGVTVQIDQFKSWLRSYINAHFYN